MLVVRAQEEAKMDPPHKKGGEKVEPAANGMAGPMKGGGGSSS